METLRRELTKHNHFEFGRLPEDPECFIVKVGEPGPVASSPKQQAAKDARTIFENCGQPWVDLCLSGGIDSECMLQSFLAANVPVKAHFFKFKNLLNEYDIHTNIENCRQAQVEIVIHEFDILDFFDSGEVFRVADRYECQSPQVAAHLWMLDQVQGFPCLSGNPIAPIWRDTSWFYVGLPGELHSAYFKYFLIRERAGIPWFFIYSPELIKSFFQLPIMRPYLAKQKNKIEDYTYLEKCQSYREAGFQAWPRLDKYTGFEKVREHYDVIMGTRFGTGFDVKFRHPLEQRWPFPEKYLQLVPQRMFDGH